MIEPVMYVAIGFLVACMLVIGLIPLVHARAVRLTMKRLEAATPMSMTEIQADKDQLRAEFAMSTRRLEMSVEQMKTKTTGQLAEIGKKSEAISRIKAELGEKVVTLVALEAREKELSEKLTETASERDAKTASLTETEQQLREARAALASLTTSHHDSTATIDTQRVELATLRTQAEVFKQRVDGDEKALAGLREQQAKLGAELETTRQALTEERARTETMTSRIGELDRGSLAQTTERELLERRVQELLARLDEQGKFLAEREYASDQMRSEISSTKQTEAELRTEIARIDALRQTTTQTLQAERTALETQLKQATADRSKLQEEVVTIKRDAEAAWASERMENAVMRERINDVAAEVARMTAVLEGPGSTIETILATESPRTAPIAPASGELAPPANGRGSLADRIRALQSRASRLQPSRA